MTIEAKVWLSMTKNCIHFRMVVLEFVKMSSNKSQDEREQADEAFRRVLSRPGTPIFTSMGYCHYVKSDEWDDDMK